MAFTRLNSATAKQRIFIYTSLILLNMSLRSRTLALSPLFQDVDKAARLPHDERIQLTYKRLIAIGKAYRPFRS